MSPSRGWYNTRRRTICYGRTISSTGPGRFCDCIGAWVCRIHVFLEYLNTTAITIYVYRFADFISEFLKRLGELSDTENTSTCCQEAYNKTLAKHHPWLIRKAAVVAMYTMPNREMLFKKVLTFNFHESIIKHFIINFFIFFKSKLLWKIIIIILLLLLLLFIIMIMIKIFSKGIKQTLRNE